MKYICNGLYLVVHKKFKILHFECSEASPGKVAASHHDLYIFLFIEYAAFEMYPYQIIRLRLLMVISPSRFSQRHSSFISDEMKDA